MTQSNNVLFIYGTRPEAIKIAPLVLCLRKQGIVCTLCDTGQQKDLTTSILNCFSLHSDINLDVMREMQALPNLQSKILAALEEMFKPKSFSAVLVQGDTMSAYCGALFGFYHQTPVFHIEAGLRSFDLTEPWPEEGIRQMISRIAALHFAPTQTAVENLIAEKIEQKRIFLTGNTVIDALRSIPMNKLDEVEESLIHQGILNKQKTVLITVHRRENHGERLSSIIYAVSKLAIMHQECRFILPVHPNPAVHDRIVNVLCHFNNICLCKPLEYFSVLAVMRHSSLILSDSGGIQEEAPCFGVPLLILREKTERQEGVKAGYAKLVGTDIDKIVSCADKVLNKSIQLNTCIDNPYGDGHAAEHITHAIQLFWEGQK